MIPCQAAAEKTAQVASGEQNYTQAGGYHIQDPQDCNNSQPPQTFTDP